MAKKRLSRNQKRKQKKRRRTQRTPGKDLIKRVRELGFEQKIIHKPAGQTKMSEVLRQFVEPYWHIPDDEESMRKLITTAIATWQAALLPSAERAEYLAAIAEALPEETHEDFYAIVGEMIERKEKHFARYDQTIIDYDLIDTDSGYELMVISLLPGEEG